MIHQYVTKLVDNLPDEIKNRNTPARLDLVLDGGMFNGSYLVGALHFLKEMERRNYVRVERISGASIGASVGFLYFLGLSGRNAAGFNTQLFSWNSPMYSSIISSMDP